MSEEDIDKLIDVMDLDGNGVINLEEFAVWLTNPRSHETVSADGWLETFDIRAPLLKIFKCFDTDNSGEITLEEFQECCNILGNSLRLVCKDHFREFAIIDVNGDQRIDFGEFVEWQTNLIMKSGVPNNDIPYVVEELVDSIQIVFDIERLYASGADEEALLMSSALQGAITNIAEACRRLYTSKAPVFEKAEMPVHTESHRYPTLWCDPPPVAWTTLVRKCAKDLGIMLPSNCSNDRDSNNHGDASPTSMQKSITGNSSCGRKSSIGGNRRSAAKRHSSMLSGLEQSVGKVVMIVPEGATDEHPCSETQKWYAQVIRKDATDHKSPEDDHKIYYFVLSACSTANLPEWKSCEAADFNVALEKLAPELRLFALLQAPTLSESKLPWSAVQDALSTAISMGLLQQNGKKVFNEGMLSEEVREIKEHDLTDTKIQALSSWRKHEVDAVAKKHLQDLLLEPMEVLAFLSDLHLLHVADSVWFQVEKCRLKGKVAANELAK
eukprot:TRINITY_DN8715_c0_g1_i2.p1 TRINITY_DN8715_c0_g1~~TRINITY_DN8715_c0_g1_i2.p1  ORF type:complete len:571 (+),score=126.77 TRINITY_DN8715_c0_g1_i2:224-1714(+)